MDVPVLRGEAVAVLVTLTKDGEPWNDVADYAPVAKVRRDASSTTVLAAWSVDVDDNVLTLRLSEETVAALPSGRLSWDVRFTDPTADDGFRTITWPAAGLERHALIVSDSVSRPEEA